MAARPGTSTARARLYRRTPYPSQARPDNARYKAAVSAVSLATEKSWARRRAAAPRRCRRSGSARVGRSRPRSRRDRASNQDPIHARRYHLRRPAHISRDDGKPRRRGLQDDVGQALAIGCLDADIERRVNAPRVLLTTLQSDDRPEIESVRFVARATTAVARRRRARSGVAFARGGGSRPRRVDRSWPLPGLKLPTQPTTICPSSHPQLMRSDTRSTF